MSRSSENPQGAARPEVSFAGSIARELVGAEVLVIDKDDDVREGMSELLAAAELNVTGVEDPSQAWELIDKRFFSVVVVDLDTPTPNAGLETVATVRVASPTSAVVVLTPRNSYEDAVAAVRAGAVDVITKSPDSVQYLKDRLHEAAARSLDRRQVTSVLREVRETYDTLLKRFMDAERRALDLEDKVSGRSDRLKDHSEIRILVVARHAKLAGEMKDKAGPGYSIESALTGGEALDRCGSSNYHLVMVADDIDDLPQSMVTRSIKAANADTMVLTVCRSPGGAVVDMIEGEHTVRLAEGLGGPAELVGKLDDLTEAFRVRERERRYLQAFRERHYDLLRRYAALKIRIDKVAG